MNQDLARATGHSAHPRGQHPAVRACSDQWQLAIEVRRVAHLARLDNSRVQPVLLSLYRAQRRVQAYPTSRRSNSSGLGAP